MTPSSIFIVEDEAIVAMDLKSELEGMGFKVLGIADTAEQAIDQVLALRPNLVLMDIMLKGGKDGVQAAEILRRSLDLPIIFLTSYSDPDTVARAARTAPYGYLTKPFQAKELRAGIEVALWKAQLEAQLRDSDRWFASTLRCVQDGVVVVDVDRKIRFVNSAAEALTGWSCEEATGRAVGEVVRFANRPGHVPLLVSQALELGQVVGIRHGQWLLGRDDRTVAVDESAGPVHDDQGRPMGAVLVLRQAAERLRQESMLRTSEQRFRTAFQSAPLGMALVSLQGRFLQVNDALCRLMRCTPAWLLERSQAGVSWPDDLSHEQARLAELRSLPDTVTQFEKRYLRAGSNEPVWVLVHASLLVDNEQETCFLYQVHDLTAQKEAATRLAELANERVRREASELAHRSKDEFLSRISHEMRTPLNAVIGFAQLLQLQHEAGAAMSGAYPQHIVSAGQHLLALVDDVLDVQRAGDGTLNLRMEPLALDEVLPACLELLAPLAASRNVSIDIAMAPGLRVHADPTRLRQIVLNVASNGIKYNVEGGIVRVTARQTAGRVEVSLEDAGIGMSDQQLAHLFEPFNRLGREKLPISGVGLGLVITRKLIEQMGGEIEVAKALPKGTIVTLRFASPPDEKP